MAAGENGTIRIWPMDETQGSPRILRGHEGRVLSLTFNPNGQWLASGGADGTVRLWQIQLDSVIGQTCNFAGRNFTWEEWQRLMDQSTYQKTCQSLPIPGSVYRPLLEAAETVACTDNLNEVLTLLNTAKNRAPELDMVPQRLAAELSSSIDIAP